MERVIPLHLSSNDHSMTYDPAAHGALCDSCPYKGKPVVPPEGPPDATIALVGEGPGWNEERELRPFVGRSGQLLNNLLLSCDLRRGSVYITNTTLCRPDEIKVGSDTVKDDAKFRKALRCCEPRLDRELIALLPTLRCIVPLGRPAVRVVTKRHNLNIQVARGFVWQWTPPPMSIECPQCHARPWSKCAKKDGSTLRSLHTPRKTASFDEPPMVVPTVHPAHVLRAPLWMPVIKSDLERAVRASKGSLCLMAVGVPVSRIILAPTLAALPKALSKLRKVIEIDVETTREGPLDCSLLCVGISDGRYSIVVPWANTATPTTPFYGHRQGAVGTTIKKWLGTKIVVTHNGPNFDHIVLARYGIDIEKDAEGWEDTLLAHHTFASHMPQRLDHVASMYCLYGNTPIMLANGRRKKIAKIVANKLPVDVLSLSASGIEARRVTGWYFRSDSNQTWIRIRTTDNIGRTRQYGRGLVTTPEHLIFTRRGWLRADQVRKGDRVAVPERQLSDLERGAFIGTLLGDSSIIYGAHKSGRMDRAAIAGTHRADTGLAQAKHVAVPDLIHLGKTLAMPHVDGYAGTKPQLRYRTIVSRQIKLIAELLYVDGEKRITQGALDALGPAGLAWWVADDGTRHAKGIKLYTNSFRRGDVELAREWLADSFKGPVSVYKMTQNNGNKQFVLGIRNATTEALGEYIAPYLFPCMRYKLSSHREWPPFVAAPLCGTTSVPVFVEVVDAGPFVPMACDRTMHNRSYCLSVDGNRNFFTPTALVSNCDAPPWKIVSRRPARQTDEKGAWDPQRLTDEELWLYNTQDVILGVETWKAMAGDLASEQSVYEEDKITASFCRRMQERGMWSDQERRRALSREFRSRQAAYLGLLRKQSEMAEFKPTRLADLRQALFKVLEAPILFRTMKTGIASTDVNTLLALGQRDTKDGKFARTILKWRAAGKLRQTYIDGVRVGRDQRVHPSWRAWGTPSGRLSSREPNLQNLKRGDVIRSLYGAPEGRLLVSFDFGQLEMRIAAYLSGDENLIAAVESEDVHYENAVVLFGKLPPKFLSMEDERERRVNSEWKKLRTGGKEAGFAMNYGAQAETVHARMVAQGLNVDLVHVQVMLHRLKTRYSRYFEWQEKLLRQTANAGYHRLHMSGRLRWFGHAPNPPDVMNCCDEETEALTDKGWVRGMDLQPGDVLLTKNADTGMLEWQQAIDVVKRPNYRGPLVEFKSRSFSAVTTPNHRWLVRIKHSGKDGCRTTEEIGHHGDYRIHRTGMYAGAGQAKYSDDFVELVGWVLTDGTIRKTCNTIGVTQSLRANPHNVDRIDQLFAHMGLSPSRRVAPRTQCVVWLLHGGSPVAPQVKKLFPDRTLTMEFLLSLTKDQVEILLRTMLAGDGCSSGGRTTFSVRHAMGMDAFQALCVLAGAATTAAWQDMRLCEPKSRKLINIPRSVGVWRVTLLRRDKAQVLNHKQRYGNVKRKMHQRHSFFGARPVWCPVVLNSYFVARRKGTVYITGNSPIQGGAADVVNIKLPAIEDELPSDSFFVAQVHDQGIIECPRWRANRIAKLCKEIAEEPVEVEGRDVVFPADVDVGPRWSELVEWKGDAK